MGVRLDRLPEYFTLWGIQHDLVDGWQTRSRSSGDFVEIMGVGIHHAADQETTSIAGTVLWATVNSPDKPIGNGTVTRPRAGLKFVLWGVRAANTMGRGGPLLSSRGVIPKDSGNVRMFAIEAMNDGIDEPWSEEMCDLYVLTVCAVLHCINDTQEGVDLTAGDVWSHFEWTDAHPDTVGRKNDPAGGPCRFNDYQIGRWDMDKFRGEVFLQFAAGPLSLRPAPEPEPAPVPEPTPVPTPTPSPVPEEDDMVWITCLSTREFYVVADGKGPRGRMIPQQAEAWIIRRNREGVPYRDWRFGNVVTKLEEVNPISSTALRMFGVSLG